MTEIPACLYRFRPANTSYFWQELEECIHRRRVYVSPTHSLNDPYDFLPAFRKSSIIEVNRTISSLNIKPISRSAMEASLGRQIGRTEYRKAIGPIKKSVSRAKFESHLATQLWKETQRSGGVSCFSESFQSLPMWAHYSDNGRGICVEFELDLSTPVSAELDFPSKVKYSTARPTISTVDILTMARRAQDAEQANQQRTLLEYMYLTKSSDWSYEREWRVFTTNLGSPGYREVGYLVPKAVIFGPKSCSDDKIRAKERFGKYIEIREAALEDSSYHFRLTVV